jgi:hypothetical protein
MKLFNLAFISLCLVFVDAFVVPRVTSCRPLAPSTDYTVLNAVSTDATLDAKAVKLELLGLIGTQGYEEPILADPDTKEPLTVVASGLFSRGTRPQRQRIDLQSKSNKFRGSSDTYLNLLEAVVDISPDTETKGNRDFLSLAARSFVPFIPPPLRSPLAAAGFPIGADYGTA